MKAVFLCVIFLLVIASSALGACITPEDDGEIGHSGTICPGMHTATDVTISTDNVTLFCEGSGFLGMEVGRGLIIQDAHDVRVQGCVFERYETGIYVKSSHDIALTDNTLKRNNIGITLADSTRITAQRNTFDNNSRQDIYEFTSQTLPEPEEKTLEPGYRFPNYLVERDIQKQHPGLDERERDAQTSHLLSRYSLSRESELGISHATSLEDGKTLFSVHLEPRMPLENISIYHRIPKCAADYIDQVFFRDKRLTVLEEDPMIKWWIFRLNESRTLQYEIFGELEDGCERQLYSYAIGTVLPTGPGPIETPQKESNYGFYAVGIFVLICIGFILWRKGRD